MKTTLKTIAMLYILLLSSQVKADEYLYDTIWNRQIPGGYQQLSADRQKVYALNTKLYSLDIKTGQTDTLTQDYTVRFSPNLQTYISYNDGKYFARRIQGNEIIKELGEFILNSTYSSNGDYLITFSSNQTNTAHSFKVFDTQTYEMVYSDNFSEEASITASDITFSPNGKKFMIKSTSPKKPTTQLKFHIYEFETWKKFEYLSNRIISQSDKGSLRDDDLIMSLDNLVNYKGSKVVDTILYYLDYKKELIADTKSNNTDIYVAGYAKNNTYSFLDKYNFESKKTVRFNYPNRISISNIYYLYGDSILCTGGYIDTNIGGWFWLKPVISTDITGFGLDTMILSPNPTNGVVMISNLQNNTQYNLKLNNSTGQILNVQNKYSVNSQIEYSLMNYPNGVYYLQLVNGNFSKTFKIVKGF